MDAYGYSTFYNLPDCFLVWSAEGIYAIKMIDCLWYVREFPENEHPIKNASKFYY